MKQDEITQTIEEIKAAISDGDYDSQKQKDKVQQMIEDLYYPATALEDQRYTVLGEKLYITTHLATSARGVKRSTLPMLRASKEGLNEFLAVAERLGILSKLLEEDVVVTKHFLAEERKVIVRMAKDIEKDTDAVSKSLVLRLLSALLAKKMLARLADDKVNISIHPGIVSFVRQHTNPDSSIDYRAMGQYFYETRKVGRGEGTSASLSILTAMLSWSTSPSTKRVSQKARGIQAMSGDEYTRKSWLWSVKGSMFLSLEDATTANASELMASMRLVFGKVAGIFQTGVFIRTCPATPRPGALENVKAHSPSELLNGIRKLGKGMLDETQPDYDPEGCLCVMPFVSPSCSAVAVVGHREIVMGPSFDGVTAGGGSNIIIPISQELANTMAQEVENMQLGDGMDAHEIEMVWHNTYNSSGFLSNVPNQYADSVKTRGYDTESIPIITQVRGLHEAKLSLSPPPVVEGQPLNIRGSVPAGSIEQQTFINVGSGDLAECINLEQMAQSEELPAGLVVYAPSGSSNAHVAGVGIQWGIPVIYGVMPRENGTIWTEIEGWVTDIENVDPKQYEPAALNDFYLEGCKDGDKRWNYGYHVLSQFFHTFLNGPRNDPRFEAYLAGFYTTWIMKATLAVAMGEGRHAYQGNKAKFHPVHGLIHVYTASTIAAGEKMNWDKRNAYYEILKNKEIGLENLCKMLSTYERIYSEPKWPSGSYGGSNYRESVAKAVAVGKVLTQLVRAKKHGQNDIYVRQVFNQLMGTVNTLENAVHNCSFFFNKFIANKKWFDIGTSHHKNTAKLEHQYHVVAGLHYRFYRHHVDEPHMISPIFSVAGPINNMPSQWMEGTHSTMTQASQEEVPMVLNDIADLVYKSSLGHLYDKYETVRLSLKSFEGKKMPYCEDCDSYECGCYSPTARPIHHLGTCGLVTCPVSACQQARLATQSGMTITQFHNLEKIFNTPLHHMQHGPHRKDVIPEEHLFASEKMAVGTLLHDPNATVFTEETRDTSPDESGPTWSVDSVPVTNVPFWSVSNRSKVIAWPEPLVFMSVHNTCIYPQPMVNTLHEIVHSRLLELTGEDLMRHFLALRAKQCIIGDNFVATDYETGFRNYARENDLGDLYKLIDSFKEYLSQISNEILKVTKIPPTMVVNEAYSTDLGYDYRSWLTNELFVFFFRDAITRRLGGALDGTLPSILERLQTAFGRKFVEEVLTYGK